MADTLDPVTRKDAANPVAKGQDLVTPRKRLGLAVDATNQNRIYQLDDLRFLAASPDNKYQWPERIVSARESDPNGPRPVLTINKLPQHTLQVTNEQRQNRPSIKIIPVDNKGDEEVAEVLTGIIRHIEYMSDAEVGYATAGENQVAIGEGYIRVLADYCEPTSFEQDLEICGIKNSFSVYMDPVGLQREATGRFCEWAFIVEDMSEDEFALKYPDAQPVNWDSVGNGDEWKAWFPDSRTVRVAEYYCFKTKQAKLYLWDVNGEQVTSLEGEDTVSLGVVAGQQPVKTRMTTIRQLVWQKMSGLEVLDERELPGKYIPVVRLVGNEWYIDGRMIVAGLIRNAKDAQRMFNYWKSTECETLALAPKAPFVGPAEAFEGHENDWQQANTKNFAFLKFNQFNEAGERIDKPERQIPPMPPVGIVNAALGAADDIKSSTGQYDPSLGNNPQAKSGVALAREQRKTDTGTYHYIDNQARGVRQLGRILVDCIPHYYDSRRIARIIGEDGETDHVTIDPDQPQAMVKEKDQYGIEQVTVNPSIGRYDVIVSTGPGHVSKRQEAAEMMSNVLQGNKELMGVIGDLYFKMLDVPGADEIAGRLKKMLPPGIADAEGEEQPMVNTPQGPVPVEQASQMIGQLMAGTEQMAQQLEQADVAKAQREAMLEQNKAAELAIRADEAAVKMYEAETARYLAFGTLELKQAEVDLKERGQTLDASLGLAAHAIKASEPRKPNGGAAAGATQ